MTAILRTAEMKPAMALTRHDKEISPSAQDALVVSDVQSTLRLLLDTSLDAIVVMNAAGAVVDWNSRAAEAFGWTREEAIGREMAQLFIPERYRSAHRHGLAKFLATRQGPVLNRRIEITALRRSGEEFPVELTILPIQHAGSWLFVGAVRDLSAIKRADLFREQQALKADVLYRIIGFAAESHTFEEALCLCLESVSRLTGWPVGHIYLPTEQEPVVLMPADLWCGAEEARYAGFRALTQDTYLSPGEGLPGRVWATAAPVWIADVQSDPNFCRSKGAAEIGFRSAFGFPLVSEGRVIAIAEFFTDTATEPDLDLLLTLRSIGDQVGRVFERRRAEQALREQAEALETINRINLSLAAELDLDRLINAVTEAATKVSSAAFGAFFYNVIGENGEAYMLYALAGAPRSAFENFPMPRNTAIFAPTFSGAGPVLLDDVTEDHRYGQNPPFNGMPKGHLPVRSYLAVPVVSRSGEVIGGLFFGHPEPGRFTTRHRDIVSAIAVQAAIGIDNARQYRRLEIEVAERQRVEEHQKLLLAELNHRVKNMLAVVTGIAAQTARTSRSVAAFNENFMARITSLGRAHTLLTARNWDAAPLRPLIEDLLAPHAEPHEGHLEIEGPPVSLRPKAALAVSMILHELVTNATKYGALSVANGRIYIKWNVSDGESPQVRLVWRETGLTELAKPRRLGFGSRMIEASVKHELGGTVAIAYEPEGIRYDFEFPVNQ
ncbi:MAG TPA: GAF domain-containing protein [Xanthobacteraceae bacterium]|nr:GAF domain-containing protein [Xanthobacteraceae bacterium]